MAILASVASTSPELYADMLRTRHTQARTVTLIWPGK